MASISTRLYIRWPPEEAKEETSTLVLTAYPSNTFVDLRFSKPMPTHPAAMGILEWGFAGIAHKQGKHGRWVHTVDSNYDTPFEESGVMEELANGDVLEYGQMMHPEQGIVRKYEEVWRDHNVFPRVSVVLIMVGEEPGKNDVMQVFARGIVARVGRWCQGIMKSRGEVTAERWCWENGNWKRVCKVGHGHLPCSVACLGEYEEGPPRVFVPDAVAKEAPKNNGEEKDKSGNEKDNAREKEELTEKHSTLSPAAEPNQNEESQIRINQENDREDETADRNNEEQETGYYSEGEKKYQDHPQQVSLDMKVEVGNQVFFGGYMWRVTEKTEW
ncbi:hypothetical protein RUND412_004549 [Rhizina undulata]